MSFQEHTNRPVHTLLKKLIPVLPNISPRSKCKYKMVELRDYECFPYANGGKTQEAYMVSKSFVIQ